MTYRNSFTIYPRTLKSGKRIYYYQTYDSEGNRTNARSTGQTSQAKARKYCENLLMEGSLIPRKSLKFADWAGVFFDPETCPYYRRKATRAADGQVVLSVGYLRQLRSRLTHYLMPQFGNMKISLILPKHIDAWLHELKRSKGLSHKTLNEALATMNILMKEAVRDGIISENPCDKVDRFSKTSITYQPLRVEEALELLAPRNISKYWNDHPLYYTVNLLSATTGMRMGECRGLLWENFHDTYIYVCHSYGLGGLGPTKNRETRYVPVSGYVSKCLKNLPFTREGYMFSFDGEKPMHERTATRNLVDALERMGIPPEERKARRISFHSWRSFFNTLLRSQNVSDAKIQAVIGHKSADMTDLYTKFIPEDFQEIASVQSSMFDFSEAGQSPRPLPG